jgi:hypothetical protein
VSEGRSVQWKPWILGATAAALAGCGASEPAEPPSEPAALQPSVFEPLTSTIDRAESVQQTVDQQAAEQRRRIEDAER